MICKVMLVGEGKTDIGDLAVHPAYRDGREGFLQPLLRSMVGGGQAKVELEFVGQKVMLLPRDPIGRRKAGDQTSEKASRALALASQANARALVLAFDVDKTQGRRASAVERRRKLRELRASAEAGFEHARKHDRDAMSILTILAIPNRMLEAWALADRRALAQVLGTDSDSLDYDAPEELWGDEQDPDSNHPKCVWRRVTEDAVEFADVGAAAAPSTLREECPDSFPPFADDVDRAVTECGRSAGRRESGRRRSR